MHNKILDYKSWALAFVLQIRKSEYITNKGEIQIFKSAFFIPYPFQPTSNFR